MPRTWKDLKREMPSKSRARMRRRADRIDAMLSLQDLLRERGTTQQDLADRLSQAQGNLSRTLR